MKFKDIKNLSKKELLKEKELLSEKVFGIRMKSHLKQSGNPLEVRILRRDIARINTALSAFKGNYLGDITKETLVEKGKN